MHPGCVPSGVGTTRFIILNLGYKGNLSFFVLFFSKVTHLQKGLIKPLKNERFAQVFPWNDLYETGQGLLSTSASYCPHLTNTEIPNSQSTSPAMIHPQWWGTPKPDVSDDKGRAVWGRTTSNMAHGNTILKSRSFSTEEKSHTQAQYRGWKTDAINVKRVLFSATAHPSWVLSLRYTSLSLGKKNHCSI